MDRRLIAEARKGLRPVDVYMRGCNVVVADNFEHRGQDRDYDHQYRNNVEQIAVLEPVDESHAESASTFVRVQFHFGFRWGVKSQKDSVDASASTESAHEVREVGFQESGRIEGTFVSEYTMDKPVSSEAIQEFSLHYACHQVWPFWREFVVSMCSRLNVPKPSIPMSQLPHNRINGRFALERRDEVLLAAKRAKHSKRRQKK